MSASGCELTPRETGISILLVAPRIFLVSAKLPSTFHPLGLDDVEVGIGGQGMRLWCQAGAISCMGMSVA